MKIQKVFELSNQEELIQDYINNILDAFQAYIVDKYKIILVESDREFDSHLTYIPDKAYYRYFIWKKSDTDNTFNFQMEIIKNPNWNQLEFNHDMKLLKNRLNRLGFNATGQSWQYVTQFHDVRKMYKMKIKK